VTAFQLGLESIPIYLHLSSQGGFVYDALSVVDAIQRCRIPIYSVVEGSVASAGTFISIVCQKRFICPHAFMLVHQLSGEVGGKMAEMTDEYANLTELMEVIKKLYSEHTRMSEKVLRRLLKHDLYLYQKRFQSAPQRGVRLNSFLVILFNNKNRMRFLLLNGMNAEKALKYGLADELYS